MSDTESLAPGWSRRIPVGVLGATGSVGQRFVSLLDRHPWFDLQFVAASPRNAGRTYAEAVRWVQADPLPERVARLVLADAKPPLDAPLVFSALDAPVADTAETAFAEAGALVVSNAKSHRMDLDVPLIVPEVNADHLALLESQRFRTDVGALGGGIVTNPNCSTIGLVLALAPLARAFGVQRAHVVTMQALSGAGLPGVSSIEAIDNLIPFIPGEEEKLGEETRKILGALHVDGRGSSVREHDVVVSAQCNRVAVIDGHTECVSLELSRAATADEIRAAWREFRSAPQELALPSAPSVPVRYLDDPAAPQPRLHRDLDGGMCCTVGRLQPCPALGWKFVALSHNTLRGAAGGALLVAELALARGHLAPR